MLTRKLGLGDAQDSDGDGLPDAWELVHGTNWKVPDAQADPDLDGLSNLQEYLAGTDPQDPQSGLKLRAELITPNAVTLQFLAISNRTYSLLYKDSLAAPNWSRLADIPARNTNWVDSLADPIGSVSNRFYRITTPALP
jgi:Bacterial TSP3 repeat